MWLTFHYPPLLPISHCFVLNSFLSFLRRCQQSVCGCVCMPMCVCVCVCVCVCACRAYTVLPETSSVTNVICVLSEPDVITRLKSTTHQSHQLSASPNLRLQGVTWLLIKTAGYSDGSFLKTFTDTVLAKSTSTLRRIHYEDDCHHDHMWYYLLKSV